MSKTWVLVLVCWCFYCLACVGMETGLGAEMSKTWVLVSVGASVVWLAWKWHQWKSVKDSNYDTFKRHWSKEEYESFAVWLARHPLSAGEP